MGSPAKAHCPHCPGSSRLFVVPRGLSVHISHMHRDIQPPEPPDPPDDHPQSQTDSLTLNDLSILKRKIAVLKHIPKGARNLVAGKLKSIIDKCVTQNGVEDWFALLSFSFTVLKVPDKGDPRSLTVKVKHNVENTSPSIVESNLLDRPNSLLKKIQSKVYDGDLRGAVRLLVTDGTLAPNNNETIQSLREKHPNPSRTLSMPAPPNLGTPHLEVNATDVAHAIGSFYSGSASGLDGLRPEHLKELISVSAGDNGIQLLQSLTNLCNFMLRGMVNVEVCPFLYGASLCALAKKDGGVRPIAVSSVFRRLVAKMGCRAVKSEIASYLQPKQLGFGTAMGCEAAIHATRAFTLREMNNDSVVVKVDIKNAFNSLERDVILEEVKERTPTLYPFLHQCYFSSSKLFYNGVSLSSDVGAQQGDPLGPMIFSLAIHKIVNSLESPLNLWYLDDGTLGGHPDTVFRDFDILFPKLRELGLEINPAKCEIFFNNTHSASSWLQRFEAVVPGIKVLEKKSFTLLGAPIFEDGVPDSLKAKRLLLSSLHTNLLQLPSHVALILLRNCFSMPRLTYLLRTCPSWFYPQDVSLLDNLLKDTLEKILNINMNEKQWCQATLPVRHGGLGVRCVEGTGVAAFLASAFGVSELVTRILTINGDSFEIPFAVEALTAYNILCPNESQPENKCSQRCWDDVISKVKLSFLADGVSGRDLARLKAVVKPESGAWLHALPSPQLGTLLDNDSLRIATALRLGCEICQPHHCVCGAFVDGNGLHGLSCVRSAGRFSRHHALNEIIRHALVSANVPCTLEPLGLSRTDGKRPDGLTLIPWERGRCLLWDATCCCTYAACHVSSSMQSAGSAAESAARSKHLKYADLKSSYIFVPVAVETSGVWSAEAKHFVMAIGRRLRERGLDPRSGSYLMQRLAIAIQRGNSASIMGTFPRGMCGSEN